MTTTNRAALLFAILPLALSGTAMAKPLAPAKSFAQAETEFRTTLHSSRALRVHHALNLFRTKAILTGSVVAGGGVGFAAASLATGGAVPLAAAVLGVAGGSGLSGLFVGAAGSSLEEAKQSARKRTAEDAVIRGLITQEQFNSWDRASLFGRYSGPVRIRPTQSPPQAPSPAPAPHTTTTTTTTTTAGLITKSL